MSISTRLWQSTELDAYPQQSDRSWFLRCKQTVSENTRVQAWVLTHYDDRTGVHLYPHPQH